MKPLPLTVFALVLLACVTASTPGVRAVPIVDPPAPPNVVLAGKPEGACLAFTQEFYESYPGMDRTEMLPPLSAMALKKRRANFSVELRRRLEEDFSASAKAKDKIVGLDFDPFLNTQDPAQGYVARKVTRRGKRYFVDVFGITGGTRRGAPDVTPELVQRGKTWIFVNFHYHAVGKDQPKSDLLGILKQLRDDRAKHRRKASNAEQRP